VPTLHPDDAVVVARIVAPFGIRGELKAELWTDFPERLAQRTVVYVGPAGNDAVPYPLEGVRFHRGYAILKLAGCDTRIAAERFRGHLVSIPLAEAYPRGPGEYLIGEVIGLEVWTDTGDYLGTVEAVLATGANDVYSVHTPAGRELLLPAIPEVIRSIDVSGHRMTIHLLDGLL